MAVETITEKWERDRDALKENFELGNLLEMNALAADLCDAVRDALNTHADAEEEEGEPDELSRQVADELDDVAQRLTRLEGDMMRAGWQYP